MVSNGPKNAFFTFLLIGKNKVSWAVSKCLKSFMGWGGGGVVVVTPISYWVEVGL